MSEEVRGEESGVRSKDAAEERNCSGGTPAADAMPAGRKTARLEQSIEHLKDGRLRIASRDAAAMAAMATMPGAAGDAVRRHARMQARMAADCELLHQAQRAGALFHESLNSHVAGLIAWLEGQCYLEAGAYVARPHKHYETWCVAKSRPRLDQGSFYEALRQALALYPQHGPFGYGLYGLGLRSGK